MGATNTRNICFTVNNPTCNELPFNAAETNYAIWQLEKGEANGTLHLQGYVEFKRPLSFHAIKKILGKTAHLEKRKGTRDQARNYCRKEDTRAEGPWEFGVWSEKSQGRRNDIELIIRLIKEGKTEDEIAELHPIAWRHNYVAMMRYIHITAPPRSWRTEFHVYIGDPGTGKSKRLHALWPDAYWKPFGKWFDDYNGNSPIILDEMDQQELPIGMLLKMADRFPLRVERKCGFINFSPKIMYAVSNQPLEKWYPNVAPIALKALMRRIDSITTFKWYTENGRKKIKVTTQTYQVDIIDIDDIYTEEAAEANPFPYGYDTT